MVQGVLRQLRTAIDVYATPDHRPGYLERLAETCRGLAVASEPGSDRQLAFSRAFAGAAVTDEQIDLVAALLDGSAIWAGLAIDTDMRWFLLQQLVGAGRFEEDAITAEVQRDDTATGRRQAAVARAARPTSVAKDLAWADILDRPDLPNAIIEATIGGFVQPDQVDLLLPYRDRYFAELPRVWESRTMEIAQSITMGLYPMFLIDDETLAATDAFLAQEGLNSACRRLVVEGRDGIVRAMKARAADA